MPCRDHLAMLGRSGRIGCAREYQRRGGDGGQAGALIQAGDGFAAARVAFRIGLLKPGPEGVND